VYNVICKLKLSDNIQVKQVYIRMYSDLCSFPDDGYDNRMNLESVISLSCFGTIGPTSYRVKICRY